MVQTVLPSAPRCCSAVTAAVRLGHGLTGRRDVFDLLHAVLSAFNAAWVGFHFAVAQAAKGRPLLSAMTVIMT